MSPAPARRVVVLISGRGSNMQRLIEHSRAAGARYEVVAVLSDQPAAPGLALARDFGCTVESLGAKAYADRSAYDAALADAIQDHAPDLVVLAGFMRILTAAFVLRFEGRMLNIHPSLLPLYPGLHTHRRVLAARESVHGATVHFVTAELDGGPAVIQGRVDVDRDDDEISLSLRVQGVEHRIYPLAVDWFCGGRLEQRDGRAWLDGTWLREPIQWSDTARKAQ